jgi:hypothetical protein
MEMGSSTLHDNNMVGGEEDINIDLGKELAEIHGTNISCFDMDGIVGSMDPKNKDKRRIM